jgi:hypothetical protein
MPSWPGSGRAEAEEIPGCSERDARCCGRYPNGRGAALAAPGFAAARSDGAAFGGPAGLAESPESPVVAGPAVAGEDLYAGSADPLRVGCAAARSAAPVGTPAAPVGTPAAPVGTRAAAPVGTPVGAPVGWPRCSSRLNGPRLRNRRCPPDWSPAESGWPAPVGAGDGYAVSLLVCEE